MPDDGAAAMATRPASWPGLHAVRVGGCGRPGRRGRQVGGVRSHEPRDPAV